MHSYTQSADSALVGKLRFTADAVTRRTVLVRAFSAVAFTLVIKHNANRLPLDYKKNLPKLICSASDKLSRCCRGVVHF